MSLSNYNDDFINLCGRMEGGGEGLLSFAASVHFSSPSSSSSLCFSNTASSSFTNKYIIHLTHFTFVQLSHSLHFILGDPEGRPTCESCIRDALAQNGFKCPLTVTEGVSPDDLFPNVGLRKAAELFVKDVMQQMDLI